MRVRDLGRSAVAAAAELLGIEDDNLRPASLDEYIGQRAAVAQLKVMAGAARMRHESMPHVLIDGPPGLGKTSLALAVADATGGSFFATTGQSVGLEMLGRRLSTHRRGSVLFIDEIHTLSKAAEIMLLGAVEDLIVDLSTPVGPERRRVQPFTLLGATTAVGDLSEPLKDRFGHTVQLTYYDVPDLTEIVTRSAGKLDVPLSTEAAIDVAERSHGVPRVANSYVGRLSDYALVNGLDVPLTAENVCDAFSFFDIDELGLTERDREYIRILYSRFNGGPVGAENMAVSLGTDVKALVRDTEPLLLRIGLIARARHGRMLREDGRTYARELFGEVE